MNLCLCKLHAIYISSVFEWATTLQCELELHVFNKHLQTSARDLSWEMHLTYVDIKLNLLINFWKGFYNIARFANMFFSSSACFVSFFLSDVRILCIEILHVYQRVESIHKIQTGFLSFWIMINKFFFSFIVTPLYWNEDSTIKKKINIREYQNIPTRLHNNFLHEVVNKQIISTHLLFDGLCSNFKRC